jgi:hypothetical protein
MMVNKINFSPHQMRFQISQRFAAGQHRTGAESHLHSCLHPPCIHVTVRSTTRRLGSASRDQMWAEPFCVNGMRELSRRNGDIRESNMQFRHNARALADRRSHPLD